MLKMKKNILLLIMCLIGSFCEAQERPETGIALENLVSDLKVNKVSSVSIQYCWNLGFPRPADNVDKGIEIYDSLGRNIEGISLDSLGQVKARWKYYYEDSLGKYCIKVERYNAWDSLIEVQEARRLKDGKLEYIRFNGGVSCFGHFKYRYDERGLIKAAIWQASRGMENGKEYYVDQFSVHFYYTFAK